MLDSNSGHGFTHHFVCWPSVRKVSDASAILLCYRAEFEVDLIWKLCLTPCSRRVRAVAQALSSVSTAINGRPLALASAAPVGDRRRRSRQAPRRTPKLSVEIYPNKVEYLEVLGRNEGDTMECGQ